MATAPQETFRRRYREMRPGWAPSGDLYHAQIAHHVTADTRLLEIGCGRKGFPKEALRKGVRPYGVDPDVDAVRRNPTVPFRAAARGEHLPFADASFDLVCSAWVMEHVEQPRAFAAEIARVLAPGGRFVFVTPNGLNPVTWIIRAIPNGLHPAIMRRVQRREVADTYPVRYRINTPRALEQIMGGVGLECESLTMNDDPTYVAVGPASFRAATIAERLFDLPALQRARIHLLGVYRKPALVR
ncbi:MAG: class I SAM-dependent methyltransferase [Actinomycetota bacterium]